MTIYQYASNQACAPYRMFIPGSALHKLGRIKIRSFQHFSAQTLLELIKQGDMLIVQRLLMSPGFRKVAQCLKTLDKTLVFDIDDDLFHLPSTSRFANRAPIDYLKRLIESISICDAVQCSTPHLLQIVEQYKNNVVVLENQLEAVPKFKPRNVHSPTIIGYAAGEDHWLDWCSISDTYNDVVAKLENKGLLIETWILGDRAIFDSVVSGHKRFFPMMPRQKYLDVLSDFDISIIPLADIRFNYSKSDIKFLESAAYGATVLASELVYSDTMVHGKTGFCYRNVEEFGILLEQLIKAPDLRQEMAKKAYDYVAEHRLINQHVHKWEETYIGWHSKVNKQSKSVNV